MPVIPCQRSTGATLELADALARIVDDESEPIGDLVRWSADQLLAGRECPAVLTDLIDGGWPASIAETAVEAARVQTRRARGVVTRADVLVDLDMRHARATAGLAAFYRAGVGPLGILAFLTGLRSAVVSVRRLYAIARRPDRSS